MSPPPNLRLLVVDDEPDLRTLYELTLLREGYDVESAATVEEGWALLQERGPGGFQLVITDMRLPDGTGLDLLRRIDDAGRGEKAIVITAYGSPENAVEALKAGAYDYLTKPVDLRQFRSVVASALGRAPGAAGAPPTAAPAAPRGASPRRTALQRLLGDSAAMVQVRGLIEKVGRSMAPVLVHGESGTGKELVARAIHDCSPRGAGPFVAVNCGAIPETLLEAEFFGYRKGAFTGANEDRDGFFQAAQGGTLFLDEIGDLPLAMQSKLLRVIQERAVRPIGAVTEVPVNVRIVSATHRDLAAEVHGARFRQDLYYRLNVIRIGVPPLRERIGDVPAICTAVIARIAHDAGVRSAQPFIAVNCGAIPEQLLEAEFFGYRKGAFTGANEDRDGFFQAARGGTLFLDEIGDLPLSMQSKLLRSIQERSVRPVGATTEMPLDVRIVSATHRNLAADVQAGRFRQDLYYRLNVIQIRVPALRERLEDLPAICERVLERITADAGVSPPPRLTREALAYLLRYPFGGNVRELENLLHRAVALCEGDVIDVQTLDLPESAFADNGRTEAASLPADPPPPRGESAALVAAPPAVPAALPDDLAAYLDAVERDILVRALEHYRFNRTAAGASMGLSLRQMRYRMARLGVMVAEHGVALESGGSEGPDVAP